ncbi:uncharacterized protein LOC123715027 [Pieris brassicae]|uniref:uncharacterized protein LOC123715027 n=1 Tax=Pieris brassicae TaxID=7116 RepID=UPI001E65FD59|nr:uncharacterized protein LOC123715027 [Pieris brassicae]
METMQVDCDMQPDKDDSGCIQDDMSPFRQISLLDLSDDVLLYILRLCSPRDLKALGYTCPRLGILVQERSLWRHVDARNEVFSTARLEWYLAHMLHEDTQELLISGHARECSGCLGLINTTRAVAEEDLSGQTAEEKKKEEPCTSGNTISEDNISVVREMPFYVRRHHSRYYVNQRVDCLPRPRDYPAWSDDSGMGRSGPQSCVGPQFTLTPQIMRQLRHQCNITILSLEYCNVNCNVINLSQFPKTLKRLSLRGTKFFNLIIDRSFLTKICKCLPALEYLDLSECDWLEPSSLLPLSKHPTLTHLIARECYKLTEFVAYASLTSRYGFRTLKVLDLRGSPVGDSEVAALGWLPYLEELWLSAAHFPKKVRHAHYSDDEYVPHTLLDNWELQEPDYYQKKSIPEPIETDEEDSSFQENVEPEPSTSREGPTLGPTFDAEANKRAKDVEKRKSLPKEPEEEKKDDNDDDDDDGQDGPSDPKRTKRDATIHVHIERIRLQRQNENQEENPNPAPSASNVIVIGPNEEPQHPLYCVCPKHRSVEKTDKSTETDMSVCDCPKKKNEKDKENKTEDPKDEPSGSRDERNDNARYVRFRRNQNSVTVNFADDSEITVRRLPRNEEANEEENRPDDNANQENPQKRRKFSDILRAFAAHLETHELHDCKKPSKENKEGDKKEDDKKEDNKKEDVKKEGDAKDDAEDDKKEKDEIKPEVDDPKPGPSGVQPKPKEEPEKAKPKKELNPICARNPNLSHLMQSIDNQHINIHVDINQENANQEQNRPENPNPNRFEAHIFLPRNSVSARNPNLNMLVQNASPEIPDPGRNMENLPFPGFVHPMPPFRGEPLRDFQYILEPRHHVLYVSVGSQFNTFRFPRESVEGEGNLDLHIDSSSLVTDFSIRRFGRADGENVNFIHFGPNGPVLMGNGGNNNRPDRSNLRVLSVTGYRNITDRSLLHLISAAPHLRRLDFSSTMVTDSGVENFRNLRPDCEVIYSPFEEKPKPK